MTRWLVSGTMCVVLLVWAQGCSSREPASSTNAGSPELRAFLLSYFATWSSGDMSAWSDHFHERAVIAVLRDGQVMPWSMRDDFVSRQSDIRSRYRTPPVERMLSMSALEEDRTAQVSADWELTRQRGSEREKTRGTDRFTLMKDAHGRWKIVTLVFYSTE